MKTVIGGSFEKYKFLITNKSCCNVRNASTLFLRSNILLTYPFQKNSTVGIFLDSECKVEFFNSNDKSYLSKDLYIMVNNSTLNSNYIYFSKEKSYTIAYDNCMETVLNDFPYYYKDMEALCYNLKDDCFKKNNSSLILKNHLQKKNPATEEKFASELGSSIYCNNYAYIWYSDIFIDIYQEFHFELSVPINNSLQIRSFSKNLIPFKDLLLPYQKNNNYFLNDKQLPVKYGEKISFIKNLGNANETEFVNKKNILSDSKVNITCDYCISSHHSWVNNKKVYQNKEDCLKNQNEINEYSLIEKNSIVFCSESEIDQMYTTIFINIIDAIPSRPLFFKNKSGCLPEQTHESILTHSIIYNNDLSKSDVIFNVNKEEAEFAFLMYNVKFLGLWDCRDFEWKNGNFTLSAKNICYSVEIINSISDGIYKITSCDIVDQYKNQSYTYDIMLHVGLFDEF